MRQINGIHNRRSTCVKPEFAVYTSYSEKISNILLCTKGCLLGHEGLAQHLQHVESRWLSHQDTSVKYPDPGWCHWRTRVLSRSLWSQCKCYLYVMGSICSALCLSPLLLCQVLERPQALHILAGNTTFSIQLHFFYLFFFFFCT